MKFKLLLLLTFLCANYYSQIKKVIEHGSDTLQVISYHKNGKIKDSTWITIEILVGKKEIINSNHPGDSIVMKIETPFGIAKKFYKNGRLKQRTIYNSPTTNNRNFRYRKNSSLSSYEEFPFGYKNVYSKKGHQKKHSDFNKGKLIKIPKSYQQKLPPKISELQPSIKHSPLLTYNNKFKKLNIGSLLCLQLIKDSITFRHVVYEGSSNDSLIFSKFSYDHSDSKQTLKFDSVFKISPMEIQFYKINSNNYHRTHFWASFTQTAGFSMMLIPVIAVPLFSSVGVLLSPPILSVVITGLPVFIYSKHLFKKTVPKNYKFSKWDTLR